MVTKKKFVLYLILTGFLLVSIFYLFNERGIPWDSAVYIGMGKYIFSFGEIGLWEPARPLVLPIFFGFLWKAGLNPMIFGKILGIVFSLGCVYLTYLIGKRIFNEDVALLCAFFLAFSPTFLFYSSTPLTGISSTFFALLAVYFFIDNKYFLSGLFLGLSFMTRFLQLFVLMVIIFVLFLHKKNLLKKMTNIACGFSIIVVPYLIVNTFLYKNPIYPFLFQAFLTKITGWIFHEALPFYFINLIKENFLVFFVLIGILGILRKRDFRKITILSIFLLFFIFLNSIVHKEVRFVLVFLPYMYMVMSCGIFEVFRLIKKRKYMIYLAIAVIGVVWMSQEINQAKVPVYKEYPEFSEYMVRDDVKKGIWVSNPLFIVDSNKKADELIYYPVYNSGRIDKLKLRLAEAGHILIDTCDILPCPPRDVLCEGKTNEFLDYVKKDFEMFYYKKENGCEQFIFRR